MKSFLKHSLFVVALVSILIAGCAKLQVGADPLIVGAERVERTAASSFTLFLRLDDSDRDFYKEKLPELHKFATWLREPMPWGGTNRQRSLVLVHNLQNVKAAYRADKSNSNILSTAIVTLQSAVAQADAWRSSAPKAPITP